LKFTKQSLQWFRNDANKQGHKEEQFYLSCMDRTKNTIGKGFALLGAGPWAMDKQQRYEWQDADLAVFAGAPYAAGVGTVRASSAMSCQTYNNMQ
jgi:hypothetical protein